MARETGSSFFIQKTLLPTNLYFYIPTLRVKYRITDGNTFYMEELTHGKVLTKVKYPTTGVEIPKSILTYQDKY